MSTRYRYTLDFYKDDGTSVGQVPIAVDWVPAVESVWLLGLRRCRLQPDSSTQAALILPRWHGEVGEPYVSGFSVEFPSTNGGGLHADFSTTYFKPQARDASALLVQRGRLKDGERFRYLAMAYTDREEPKAGPKLFLKTEEVTPPLPLAQSTLADFVDSSTSPNEASADDMPVFIPKGILEETAERSSHAGAKEVGGILVGHLHRDPGVPEVFLEITGQLPARHTEADCHSLTFTAETWTAARAALELRRRREIFVGWWHSHVLREWCKKCPPEKQKVCPLAQGFFSLQDQQVHRTVFPRAYSVALVVNDAADRGVTHSLYGWRHARLETRGFHIIDDVRPATGCGAEAGPMMSGGKHDAT